MNQEGNLENINLPYESFSQQKLQLDKLCDDLFKYNLTQNELKKIMQRSAERSLVILNLKKYGKEHSREVTTDSGSHMRERQGRAQPQQNNSQNDELYKTHKPYCNRQQKTQFERQIKSREQQRQRSYSLRFRKTTTKQQKFLTGTDR